jgi:hypothetical protein
MKRAVLEKVRTPQLWSAHLRACRRDAAAFVCETQVERFLKVGRLGGCGRPRCWFSRSQGLGGVPKFRRRRAVVAFEERLVESLLANNALERTVRHSGPRLAAASASWPAAQLGR